MKLACFVCPVDGEFAATIEYRRALKVPDRPPERIARAMIGVAFEPLRRLWPLLDDQPHVTTLFQRAKEMPASARCAQIEVHAQEEVPAVAGRLAEIGSQDALAFAESHASVDALLAGLGYRESGPVSMAVPALLAAAGRVDDAREALARYGGEMDLPEPKQRERRFVYQLTRWLESGCDPSLLPGEPPPARNERDRNSSGGLWSDARARRAAVDAVKQERAGRDRAELREMLLAEIATRGVAMDQLDVEQALNHLTMSAAERSRRNIEGLKLLGKFGLTVAKAIGKRELPEMPDLSAPEWLESPVPALYTFPVSQDRGRSWVAVLLDPGSDRWLEQAHAAAPRLIKSLETVDLHAWITWSATPNDDLLEVHVGERRVGLLDQEATAAYRPIMDAAARRAELPCLKARLTPIAADATYLLEVALPAKRQPGSEPTAARSQPS